MSFMARDQTYMDIGQFFFENGLAFNIANSPSFVNMCRSIGRHGTGLRPPTAHELRTSILNKEEENTKAIVADVKKTWIQTGVSILLDGWKDMRGRQLINFLVNNPRGTVFLRTVDASDAVEDAEMLFKLLDDVVEEIGEDIVVQVVTDNTSNYKKAGEKLMEKRKQLWWTPCAAHCIDLMLEKLGELPQHKNAFRKAKKVINFIYNHGWVLAMMRKFCTKELIQPAFTRSATTYLTLQSMFEMKQGLEQMLTSKEWERCTWSKKLEGREIKKIVLRDESFWQSILYALKTTRPLVSVLRMVYSEKVPGMGFIYGAIDKAKKEISNNLGGDFEAYNEILKIIDNKLEYQLHNDLHAAAYFLNPRFQYLENKSKHPEIKFGLYACLEKLIPNELDCEKADEQIDYFKFKRRMFSLTMATKLVNVQSPADWWLQFGDETPELTSFAVRVLSLTCSSSFCERNWNAFNMIHSKRRNRLVAEKLNSLVYIMYNRKLRHKFLKAQSATDDVDPLVEEEVPSDNEWVVEEDDVGETSGDDGLRGDVNQPSGSGQQRQKRSRDTRKRIQSLDSGTEWGDDSSSEGGK